MERQRDELKEVKEQAIAASNKEWQKFVSQQLQAHKELIEENNRLTAEAVNSAKEVVEFFNTFKTGLKIMARIQDGAIWLAKIATAGSILYAMAKWGLGQILNDIRQIK